MGIPNLRENSDNSIFIATDFSGGGCKENKYGLKNTWDNLPTNVVNRLGQQGITSAQSFEAAVGNEDQHQTLQRAGVDLNKITLG